MQRHPVTGSERLPIPGATSVGKADPTERLEVTLLLRRRQAERFRQAGARLAAGGDPGPVLSRAEFDHQFGASPGDIQAVTQFAAANGLTVVQADAGRRTVVLSGTVAAANVAFDVDLQRYFHNGGSYRGRTGVLTLPDTLQNCVEAVLGLDNRPAARAHFRARPAAAVPNAFTPPQIAGLYDFPPGSGQGQCVALIELGGGERPADLSAYFAGLQVQPTPRISIVSVDHGHNLPTGNPDGADGEVMLDIEMVGAIAPAANIVVYFAPNTDAGFLDAVTTAIHDRNHNPSVLSISWGGPESGWTAQAMTAFDQAFQAAAMLGITVCVAAGDGGSDDGVGDGAAHVDFPASSPHALACGGTRLQAAGGQIVAESVWNDGPGQGAGGGGVSRFFARPTWQNGLNSTLSNGTSTPLSMRGVPDVAGNADPDTGYQVRIDGQASVIGGTSAVAPLWAALIARINAANGRPAGLIHPKIYGAPDALRDIITGNNGDFAATKGWDACTGLGSPSGTRLAQLL